VSTPITVANRHGTAQDVGFDIGTMTGGGSTFTPPVRLDPATLSLAPGEEGTVVLSLELAASLFRAGERYRCQVRLVGGDDLVLDVSVMVSPDA
jgi:hypothetical protein